MKKLVLLLTLACALFACNTATEVDVPLLVNDAMAPKDSLPESSFDSVKAAQYGADDYGMKQYVMAFLKKGPNRERDSTAAFKLQKGHMDNIKRMADEGTLVLAGPFLDDGDLRGIYIFNVTTIEEAEALTATDPAIQAGSLIMELHPWYGSAALMHVSSEHKEIAKVKF